MYNVITCDNVGSQFKYVKKCSDFLIIYFFPSVILRKWKICLKKSKMGDNETFCFHIMYKNWLIGRLQKRVATFEHSKCSISHVAT